MNIKKSLYSQPQPVTASKPDGYMSSYADPDLPHRARTVYMYLRDRAGGGSCWPGIKTIAHDLHLSPRTVQRALNDLERAGYIQRQRRHRENGSCTSNLYIINIGGK